MNILNSKKSNVATSYNYNQSKEQTPPNGAAVTKPRNAFIAFLLSLFTPGLGQIYNGQGKKGIIFFALILINPIVFGMTRGLTYFYGLFFILIIEISLRVFIIVDAIKNAKRQNKYIPKNYNTWYKHLFIACTMIAVLHICDIKSILGMQTFKISLTANQPTIQAGDRVVCDKKIYQHKQPSYGDLIIYQTKDGSFHPGRIVGLPNDNLEINNDIVSINGKQSKSTFIKETFIDTTVVLKFEEESPNGHKYSIYKFKYPLYYSKTTIKNITVPNGDYYILGDNRDNSFDSRDIGFIQKERIVGEIMYSYWGKTLKRINIDFRNK